MRLLRPLLLLVVLVLAMAAPAAAHTEIESTTPADGATVADPPSEVVIEFGGDLQPDSPVDVRVLDPNADDLVAGESVIEGRTVTVPLNPAVTEGVHTVDVAFTAADGDDQVQTVTFTYAPPAGVATPTEDLTGPPVDPAPSATAPTPTPTPTAEPTAPTEMPSPTTASPTTEPAPTDTAPTDTASDGSAADLVSDDGGGGIGVGPVVLAVVLAVALAAVLVVKARRPGVGDTGGAGVTDADEDR